MDFFSLGSTCQTAHQIRRHTKDTSAYFFDWLISNNDSYKALLIDIDKQLKEENCRAIEVLETSIYTGEVENLGKIRVLDNVSGIEYQHEFPLLENNFIDESKIAEHLSTAKQKFTHLKNKTTERIKTSSAPVLVRYENFKDTAEALETAKVIKEIYREINPNIKVVITSCFLSEEAEDNDIFIYKIAKPSSWKGDDASWTRVFQAVQAASKTA
ncbi:DUF1796 family putative cysteine peptidase [Pseudomonas sp. PS01302]|uniref:DUF1796 family putative cysteine peptidase n=1 Tax=Pseudomonas sp. PS01302 TaxID=2991438 RepID=UPI00249BC5DC|nr:DUF1796 family putative cysteine peptidase [Pseudomonas sp. PS01302]